MHLFLTSVLPFLAHDHASAAVFLTCRYHNFHSSIIPEFLSDEERVKSFYGARPAIPEFRSYEDASRNCAIERQPNCFKVDDAQQYANLYNLFVQTPLMQFSPSLVLHQNDCDESILKPLLETKYFTRTLQRCSFGSEVQITNDLLHVLSKVQSLTKLVVEWKQLEHDHLATIINSFLNLETLTICGDGEHLRKIDTKILHNPLAPCKSLRCLTVERVYSRFAIQFVPNCPNLRKLELSSVYAGQPLDLLPLSSSLPLLTDLDLKFFALKNSDSLKNLVHLSTLEFRSGKIFDLSFLTQESLPQLTTLSIDFTSAKGSRELSTSSLACLSHASNLQDLEVISEEFDNNCLQYLDNMVHLRKLRLSSRNITGETGLFKTLFQLEELNLMNCNIGNQDAIRGALYSTHSRLRVLNLINCCLVDDDLDGIVTLENTLEVLYLEWNMSLTNQALMHCKDLVKLKSLDLQCCSGINDLSPLKDCLNLEELDLGYCNALIDASFKVFGEEINSFPNLRRLNLSYCRKLTKEVFEYLSKNDHLVHRLKELNVEGLSESLLSSQMAQTHICQLKGLQRLYGILSSFESESDQNNLESEVLRNLKNLEEIN